MDVEIVHPIGCREQKEIGDTTFRDSVRREPSRLHFDFDPTDIDLEPKFQEKIFVNLRLAIGAGRNSILETVEFH
jgi:hypothetical protein